MLQSAGKTLAEGTKGKKPAYIEVEHHHGGILHAAKTCGLDEATGTPSTCSISRAIITAAYDRDPATILADFEEAFEHYQKLESGREAA